MIQALEFLKKKEGLSASLWHQKVAAISVGLKDSEVFVDLDYEEDSSCDVDMNIVLLGADEFVEIQGTAENKTFKMNEFENLLTCAKSAIRDIHALQTKVTQSFLAD